MLAVGSHEITLTLHYPLAHALKRVWLKLCPYFTLFSRVWTTVGLNPEGTESKWTDSWRARLHAEEDLSPPLSSFSRSSRIRHREALASSCSARRAAAASSSRVAHRFLGAALGVSSYGSYGGCSRRERASRPASEA